MSDVCCSALTLYKASPIFHGFQYAQRKAQAEAEAQKAEQSTKTIVIDDTIEHGTVFLHYRTNNGEEIVESYAGTVEVQPGENGPVYHVYTDQEEMEE